MAEIWEPSAAFTGGRGAAAENSAKIFVRFWLHRQFTH